MWLGENSPKVVVPAQVIRETAVCAWVRDPSSACSFPSQTAVREREDCESHISLGVRLLPSRRHSRKDPIYRDSRNRWGGYESVLHRTTGHVPVLSVGDTTQVSGASHGTCRLRHAPRSHPRKGNSAVVGGFRPGGHIVSPASKPPLRQPTNTSPLRRVSDGSVPLPRSPPRRRISFPPRSRNMRLRTASSHRGTLRRNPIYRLVPFLLALWFNPARTWGA